MREEFIILGIIAAVLIVAYFILKNVIGKKLAAQFALICITEAEERLFGLTDVGDAKFDFAITFLYSKLPTIIQVIYPKEDAKKIIQDAFNKFGKQLTDKLREEAGILPVETEIAIIAPPT